MPVGVAYPGKLLLGPDDGPAPGAGLSGACTIAVQLQVPSAALPADVTQKSCMTEVPCAAQRCCGSCHGMPHRCGCWAGCAASSRRPRCCSRPCTEATSIKRAHRACLTSCQACKVTLRHPCWQSVFSAPSPPSHPEFRARSAQISEWKVRTSSAAGSRQHDVYTRRSACFLLESSLVARNTLPPVADPSSRP